MKCGTLTSEAGDTSQPPGDASPHNHPPLPIGRGRVAISVIEIHLVGDQTNLGLTVQTLKWGDQLFQFVLG